MKKILTCIVTVGSVLQAAEIKLKNQLSVPIDVQVHYKGKWHSYFLNPGQKSKKINSGFFSIDQVRWKVPQYRARSFIFKRGKKIPFLSREFKRLVPAACYQTNKKKLKIKALSLGGIFKIGSTEVDLNYSYRLSKQPPYFPRAQEYFYYSSTTTKGHHRFADEIECWQ